jgi:hypothetical protein
MATHNGKPLDELAERYEAKLRAIRQIQQILVQHPDLASELGSHGPADLDNASATSAAIIASRQAGSQLPSVKGRQTKSQAERVADYLIAMGNRPQTVKDIVKGAGIPRNSVNYVLYTSRPSHFERTKTVGESMKWRLSVSGMQAYQDSANGATDAGAS